MYLNPQDMPSKGLFTDSPFNLTPMRFDELIDYVETPEKDDIGSYKKDIEKLFLKRNVDLDSYSVVDLDYLLYMTKAVTINEDLKFNVGLTCSHDHSNTYVLSISDIRSLDFEDANKIPVYIELDGTQHPISVPTIGKFYKVLTDLSRFGSTSLTTIRLASLFERYDSNPNEVVELINSANGDDPIALMHIENLIFGRLDDYRYKCKECGSEEGADLTNIVRNFFRLYIENRGLDRNKIGFK